MTVTCIIVTCTFCQANSLQHNYRTLCNIQQQRMYIYTTRTAMKRNGIKIKEILTVTAKKKKTLSVQLNQATL